MSGFIETGASKQLEDWLSTWHPRAKKAVLLYGPVGVGKTATLHYVAKKLGFEVLAVPQEWDYKRVLLSVQAKDFWSKQVVHLDRPYTELGLKGKQLRKIIELASKPVVIEDTDSKYYEWLALPMIRVEPPPKTKIAQILREQAIIKPNYRLVGSDVRQALMLGLGSQGYQVEDWMRELEDCLKRGNCEGIQQEHLPVLLDTLVSTCYGVECLEKLLPILNADLTGRPHYTLQGWKLPRPSTPNFYFYKKIKAAKESEQ